MLTLLFLSSCSEKDEVSEYENWQARNQHYVDSIASLANAGTDGWTKMLVYYLVDSKENPDKDNNHYVYIKKLENGTGTQSPEFKDSVRVHYIGRLIPSSSHPQGYVFGKSYSTYTFNEETDVPKLMPVASNMITGFTTALMNMVEGDRWKVVIPYYLGYNPKVNPSSKVPDYSTLIFDIKLARIYKYHIDTDTTWH
jgi:FKBP-type peptidyl-prolyl cis-trans isomerase FklB